MTIALPCVVAAARVEYILPVVPHLYPPVTLRTGILMCPALCHQRHMFFLALHNSLFAFW